MATTTRPRESRARLDEPRPADVFVAFGITGDLAKVMTFRSLYRLEKRGVLDCPIIGVAVDDWTADDLREHARAAIAAGEPVDDATFERFSARLSYLRGDFTDASTRSRGSPPRSGRPGSRSSTSRSRRSCSARSSRALPRRA